MKKQEKDLEKSSTSVFISEGYQLHYFYTSEWVQIWKNKEGNGRGSYRYKLVDVK